MGWNKIKFRGGPKKRKSFYPFRSALEKRIAGVLKGFKYEAKESKLDYVIPHKYTPDFVHPDAPDVLIEVKGYFRDAKENTKYLHIRNANPEKEVIFIFYNTMKKLHGNCRPRKDGTVMTIDEWLRKHQFLYYLERALPKEITEGKITKEWIKQQREEFGYE